MRALTTACWLSALLSCTALADAQPRTEPSAEERRAARALADTGLELFEAGKWAEAYDRFQRAETVVHAPTHLLYMARAQVEVGKLVDAQDLYRRAAAEDLGASAAKAFVQAKEAAVKELAELEPRIPKLRIVASHRRGLAIEVSVDGGAFTAPPPEPIALDPGVHRVVARASGEAELTKEVTAAEGREASVELVLGLPPATSPTQQAPTRPRGNPLLIPALAAFGAGALGIGMGTAFGAMALGDASDLKDACPSNPCPEKNRDLYDSASSSATISTVAFVVGGVGVAAGAVLLFAGARSAREQSAPSAWIAPLPGGAAAGAVRRF